MARTKSEAAEYRRLTARLPEHVFLALQERADQNRRPINTELVLALAKALRVPDRKSVAAATA